VDIALRFNPLLAANGRVRVNLPLLNTGEPRKTLTTPRTYGKAGLNFAWFAWFAVEKKRHPEQQSRQGR